MSLSFNYRHLYYFWVVAKQGGMARAAARLGMAVQTVSTQVRELERSLGHVLLKPAGRGLVLTEAHWELIRFLRQHYAAHGVQAQVRAMIRHFTQAWGPQRGSNHHLHEMFPRGGPQKQGNRLAGLLRTKGEH